MYFHALFWPALLKGAQFRTPTAIFVHGFLTVDGQKMSKSRGTFIKARTYLDHLQPEYLRYYFAAKLSSRIEDLDLNFSDFMSRVNADLVGKFVNIASRSAGFLSRSFSGQLAASLSEPALYENFVAAGDELAAKFEKLEYSQALRQIMSLADLANQYIDEKKPWALAKKAGEDAALLAEVQAICTMSLNLFRILAIYLKPILPATAVRIETFLNISFLNWEDRKTPLVNHSIQDYQALMTRIEEKQITALKAAAQSDLESTQTQALPKPESEAAQAFISIDDFAKIDLRIAKIISAEHIESADKLLRLQVDLGNEERQVIAGIKSAYQPETLVGRLVVVVANLEPRKMRFGVSAGMILAAGNGSGELWLVSPDSGAQAGMRVK